MKTLRTFFSIHLQTENSLKMFLFLLIFVLPRLITANLKMMVVYGETDEYNNHSEIQENWDNCLVKCYWDDDCLVSYCIGLRFGTVYMKFFKKKKRSMFLNLNLKKVSLVVKLCQ